MHVGILIRDTMIMDYQNANGSHWNECHLAFCKHCDLMEHKDRFSDKSMRAVWQRESRKTRKH